MDSIVLTGSLLALCGCTSSSPTPDPTIPSTIETSASTQAVAPTSAATAPASDPVLAYQPANETVLGFLDEQEGTNALGPLSTEAPAIAVYIDCRGTGTVNVQVSGLGGFTTPCQVDVEGEGLRNVFDTRSIEGEFSVEIEGETGQQWAISITETTQDTPS